MRVSSTKRMAELLVQTRLSDQEIWMSAHYDAEPECLQGGNVFFLLAPPRLPVDSSEGAFAET